MRVLPSSGACPRRAARAPPPRRWRGLPLHSSPPWRLYGAPVTAKVARISRSRVRLSRADWLAAARRIFVRTGIDEVKIDRLARELRVTRGSFYWHFKDLEDLRSALIDDWREQNRREIAAIEDRWTEEAPSLVDIGIAWLAEREGDRPVLSSAIRDWARKENSIAPLVHEIDRAWISLIARVFTAMELDPTESAVRARIIYYHRIGYHALPLDESLEDLCALQADFTRVFTGRELDSEEEKRLRELTRRLRGTESTDR